MDLFRSAWDGVSAIGASGLLALWWFTGHAWSWSGRATCGASSSGWDSASRAIFHTIFGLVVQSLLAGLLLAAGVWAPAPGWCAALALPLIGLVAGRGRRRAPGCGALAVMVPLAGLWVVSAGLNGRGEWMVGGWDPGIYIQQAATLERAGAWRPEPDPLWSALTAEELPRFTRRTHNYIEAYPVVPLDPDRRSLEPFFFPFTPLVMAQLVRACGILAACRTNELMGLLAALGLAAACWRMLRDRFTAGAVLAVLTLHPIWLYHLHFPTSEMIHVVLLAGLAGCLARARRSTADIAWIAVLFFASALNRFAFLPFAALLLAADAAFRPRGRGRTWWMLALREGASIDMVSVPITIGRLGGSVTALLAATAVLCMLVPLLAGVLRRLGRPVQRRIQQVVLPIGVALAAGLFVSLWLARAQVPELLGAGAWNARLMWAYGLPISIVFAVAGLFHQGWMRGRFRVTAWRAWLVFLLAAAALSSLTPEIKRIAPWAVRRQVEFLMPLLALSGAGFIGWARRRFGRASLGWFLLLGLLAAQFPPARAAWRATEYDGINATFRAIADRIEPSDIVIADHFKWATPLRRIYRRDVLNGEVWWDPPRPDDFRYALSRLDEMARARGGRLLFLTSTDKQLGVFPAEVAATELWVAPPWRYREVVHSARARVIEARPKEKMFRLHQWHPIDPPPPL